MKRNGELETKDIRIGDLETDGDEGKEHRKIENREKIRSITTTVIAKLIAQGADTFLFGSRSEFDSLCHEIVSEFKRNNPQLQRVYVRAEYEFINDDYTSYLLERFESTFFPKEVSNAGRASYIKRNKIMIDLCDLAVIYYDENVSPAKSHSGTARAVEYLLKREKPFINIKFADIHKTSAFQKLSAAFTGYMLSVCFIVDIIRKLNRKICAPNILRGVFPNVFIIFRIIDILKIIDMLGKPFNGSRRIIFRIANERVQFF